MIHFFDNDHDPVCDDHHNYERIRAPHELTLEEKMDLLFALMDHAKLGVFRATYDPSMVVLAPVKE